MSYIDIVLDGPPAHLAGRFVEVEDHGGASVKVGEWVLRQDGYWALRIERPVSAERPTDEQVERAARAYDPEAWAAYDRVVDEVSAAGEPPPALMVEYSLGKARDMLTAAADAAPPAPSDQPPIYLALDLWMALGLPDGAFDAYCERNGWANTWSNLLASVRGRTAALSACGEDAGGEPCVLTGEHLVHYGASDVGSSEPLPFPTASNAARDELIAEARGRECSEGGDCPCEGGLIRRLADALAAPAPVDEAKLAEALQHVEHVHQIHGDTCVCGFQSSRARSRTEHITGAVRERLEGK